MDIHECLPFRRSNQGHDISVRVPEMHAARTPWVGIWLRHEGNAHLLQPGVFGVHILHAEGDGGVPMPHGVIIRKCHIGDGGRLIVQYKWQSLSLHLGVDIIALCRAAQHLCVKFPQTAYILGNQAESHANHKALPLSYIHKIPICSNIP